MIVSILANAIKKCSRGESILYKFGGWFLFLWTGDEIVDGKQANGRLLSKYVAMV